MSLLLDALKKAADDKQKVSQNETVSEEQAAVQAGLQEELASTEESTYRAALVRENEIDSPDKTSNFNESLSQEIPQQAVADVPDDSEALTLDPIEAVQNETVLTPDEAASVSFEQQIDKKGKKPVVSDNIVSDEALALLIHKANRDVKNSKRIIVVGVLFASLAVLVFGGVYYYFEMQAEMASLERKHQIAMRAMYSKTSNEEVPEKSEIIRSFVNKAEPDDKVKLAKKHIVSEREASEKNSQQKIETRVVVKKQANIAAKNTANEDKSVLSIQRTNKLDPLGEKLDAAWLAYEKGQYDKAEKMYVEVLHLEKNNRDAMLGLGAIAIHNKDAETARSYYLALLKLDPRDPIATASIANLHSGKTSVESDEEYLLTMLESNPKAAHLNFALGNIYAQQGKWKTAQQTYFNAWQQDNENADYIFNLAVSLDQLSKVEQAIKFYKECLLKSTNKQVGFSREAVQQRIKVLSEL